METTKDTSQVPVRAFLLLLTLLFVVQGQVGVIGREVSHFRAAGLSDAEHTALDDYCSAPDTNFSFRLVSSARENGCTTYTLELTSQSWLTTNEVDRPVWKHWLTILRPDQVESSKSLLVISGGANDGKPPRPVDHDFTQLAIKTRTVVSELRMVPNQPLLFVGETQGRKEDALIANTWDRFLRTGDSDWPARLPMTKSVVKAMDAITEFCASTEGGRVKVDSFVVTGASKRGWTTWSVAAVDKRVVAIIPLVIDLLNIENSLLHHYGAYGFWSPAIKDYTAARIMDWTGTAEFRELMRIEDPFQYRDRLRIPKFIINACDDQFFLPDSSQFYFDALPGPKYLRYVPNADHSLRGSDALQTLAVCYSSVVRGYDLPEYSWKLEKDGAIRVRAKSTPSEVCLWQATNPNARDFRMDVFGPGWRSSILTPEADGTYLGKVATPEKGWTAFLVELTFTVKKDGPPLKLTTQVRVIPDTLPYRFVPDPVVRRGVAVK